MENLVISLLVYTGKKFSARVQIPGTNWKQWRNAFQWVPGSIKPRPFTIHVYF